MDLPGGGLEAWEGWNAAGFRTVQTLVFGLFPFVIVRPSSIGHRAAFPPHLHPPSKYRRNRRPRRSPSRAGCRLVLYFLHHHTPLKSIRGKKRRERAHRSGSGLGPAATDRGGCGTDRNSSLRPTDGRNKYEAIGLRERNGRRMRPTISPTKSAAGWKVEGGDGSSTQLAL